MAAAVREYAANRSQEHAWMAARFCCPPARFAEFAAAAAPLWSAGEPWRVAAIGSVGATAAAALDALAADLAAMRKLGEDSKGRAIADALEARLPVDAAYPASPETAASFLRQAGERVASSRLSPSPSIFWEFPLLGHDNWRDGVRAFATAVAAFNDKDASRLGVPAFALKIRAGGVEASAFPAPRHVAGFIAACRDAGVAFKATAGLHHPVRHFAESTSCDMHGFLNLFVGAALARSAKIDEATLLRVVEERDPAAFRVDDAAVAWRDLSAPASSVAESREALAISIGSCSFAEPVEDLQALNILPAPADARQ